jgi:hypothetical protein
MVLLDSSSPDQFTAIPSFAGSYAMTRRVVALLPSLSRLGLARFSPAAPALSTPAAAQVRAFSTSAHGLRNVRDEQSRLRDVFAQARALATLGGEPLRACRKITRSFSDSGTLVWYGQHGGHQGDAGGEVRDDLPASG